eukprot:115325_1
MSPFDAQFAQLFLLFSLLIITKSTTTTITPTSSTNTVTIETQSLCDSDISTNNQDTCLDFYTWGLCGENWMIDKCCITCGYISCLDSCYNGDINNVPQNRLTPFDCNTNISPNNENTCNEFKQWGDCVAEWMQN